MPRRDSSYVVPITLAGKPALSLDRLQQKGFNPPAKNYDPRVEFDWELFARVLELTRDELHFLEQKCLGERVKPSDAVRMRIARRLARVKKSGWTRAQFERSDSGVSAGNGRSTRMDHATFRLDLKSLSDGHFAGALAAYSNVDYVNERIMPGAFRKSLTEQKGLFPMYLNHDTGDLRSKIGVLHLTDSEKSLQASGILNLELPAAQQARSVMLFDQKHLGGHLKTGHTWTLQNRPTELSQDKSIYNPPMAVSANIFRNPA